MQKFLAFHFAFLLLCATAARPATAQAVQDTEPLAGHLVGASAADRVIELPRDAHAWHTSIFVDAQNSPRDREIVSWFDTNPQLAKLKQQTHFHRTTPADPNWSRYWNGMADADGRWHGPLISSLPAVVVQKADGEVVARFQGASPYLTSADSLARAISACIRERGALAGGIFRPRPNRPCPDCRPTPKPDPMPEPYNPDPGPYGPKPYVPDIEPPRDEVVEEVVEEEHAQEDLWVAAAVGVFLVVLVAAYVKDRQAQTP